MVKVCFSGVRLLIRDEDVHHRVSDGRLRTSPASWLFICASDSENRSVPALLSVASLDPSALLHHSITPSFRIRLSVLLFTKYASC